MKWSDLITDAADRDRASHTKVWSNIAYAASTVVFVMQAIKQTLTAEVWLIYLGIVGAHSAASKLLSLRSGKTEVEVGAK